MKSIRLTLIVYFLVLLTGALGAISWFSYQTTAHSLRVRENASQELIEKQCDALVKAVKDDLDRRLLQKAQALANMRLVTVVFDPLQQSILGFAQWANPRFGRDTFTYIDRAEALIIDADDDHPQEYFQVYRNIGKTVRPVQCSESMGNHSFTLDENLEKELKLHTGRFDDVELKPGVMVRRVTLKEFVIAAIWPRRPPPPGNGPPGGGKGPDPKGPQTRPIEAVTPTVIIQYASELGPIKAKIADFEDKRDEQLAKLGETIDLELLQLRNRMLSIALATLAALWLGGFLVIRLGLAPLAKMSEAVSQVTPANFNLPLEPGETAPRTSADRRALDCGA